MPKYRVKELSLVGNELHQAGAVVDYDGLPAENLEPLCDEGRAKYQEYLASNVTRVAQMLRENDTSAVGDPAAFAAAFAAALAKSQSEMGIAVAEALAKSQNEMGVTIGIAVAEAVARLFPQGVPIAATASTPAAEVAPAKGGKASLV